MPTSSFIVTIPMVSAGKFFPAIPSGVNASCYSITLEEDATIEINGNLEVVH